MKDKAKKFVGPTKKMAKALEDEGLLITWPDGTTDNEELAIEGYFYVGNRFERTAFIDLRDKGDLSTKAKVDAAISNQLDEEYENFSIDDEMKIYMEMSETEKKLRGIPDAEQLLKDLQEHNARLKRFAEVAEAVSNGHPIPPEESENVTLILTKDEAVALARFINGVFIDAPLLSGIGKKLENQIGE